MQTKLSREITENEKIRIDNAFITDFMPFAPENYVKVYLYGLTLAYFGGEVDAEAEIANKLNLEPGVVGEAFAYWASAGIVNLLSASPVIVEYLAINKGTLALRKFSKTKYKDFNDQLHAMLPSRNILPNEYNEYYSIMEAMHIEPEAMLAIIAYCIRLKGADVGYPYILAVARNLARQGCLTYDRVNEQLSEFDLYDKDVAAVLHALGSKKAVAIEDKRMYAKWTKTLGFPAETVVKVAKSVKKGGIDRLDALLVKYYENHLFTFEEIEEFNRNRDRLYSLTREINKRIGVYYEQLDFIIETYVTKWLGYGFTDDTLLTIAEYCFKCNIRTLEGYNATVEKFYKQGLLSSEDIGAFLGEAVRRDEEIREVLEKAGVSRPVTSRDRDSYRTWTYSWKMDRDTVLYAASIAAGNASPVSYMNSVLGAWHNAGATTLEAAKKYGASKAASSRETAATVTKTYTSEQLNAMFDSLNSEDL